MRRRVGILSCSIVVLIGSWCSRAKAAARRVDFVRPLLACEWAKANSSTWMSLRPHMDRLAQASRKLIWAVLSWNLIAARDRRSSRLRRAASRSPRGGGAAAVGDTPGGWVDGG